MKAAIAALGGDPDRLEVLIMQFVHLVEGGERASMSKRRGEFVTLDELIDEIGVDAARWFMLSRSHDTTIDLDLDAGHEAVEREPRLLRPVRARADRVDAAQGGRGAGRRRARRRARGARAGAGRARAGQEAAGFPAEVAEAAERRAPHRIATYALELAQAFTAFYRDCRVVGAEPEALESFRLALSVATQRVIARSLDLLGRLGARGDVAVVGSEVAEDVEPDGVQRLLGLGVEPRQLAGEEQDAHRDQHDAGDGRDDQ